MEKAHSVWAQSLEDDNGFVQVNLPNRTGPGMGLATSGSGPVTALPKIRAKSKATAKSKEINPMVYAATKRAKSTREFADVERFLEKAKTTAKTLLEITAPKLLGEDIMTDTTLDLVRSRCTMVQTALGECNDDETLLGMDRVAAGNLALFKQCIQDPYVKDLRSTILANEDACQTVTAIRYCRHVVLDLYLDCT